MNYCFNTLKRIVVNIYILDSLTYAWYHPCQILNISHLFNLLYLLKEIIKIKLILTYLLLQAFCFLFIKLLLSTFYKRNNITHTKNTIRHTFWMENIDSFHFFSSTYEFDRFCHNSTDRKSCTTTHIAIKFSQYHAIKIKTVIKLFCCIHSILTCHGIYHEERFIRIYSTLETGDFIHHIFIYGQTTSSINDYDIITLRLSFLYSIIGDFYNVFISFF